MWVNDPFVWSILAAKCCAQTVFLFKAAGEADIPGWLRTSEPASICRTVAEKLNWGPFRTAINWSVMVSVIICPSWDHVDDLQYQYVSAFNARFCSRMFYCWILTNILRQQNWKNTGTWKKPNKTVTVTFCWVILHIKKSVRSFWSYCSKIVIARRW